MGFWIFVEGFGFGLWFVLWVLGFVILRLFCLCLMVFGFVGFVFGLFGGWLFYLLVLGLMIVVFLFFIDYYEGLCFCGFGGWVCVGWVWC